MLGDRHMDGIQRLQSVDMRHVQRIGEHGYGSAQGSTGIEQAMIQLDQPILFQAPRSNQHLQPHGVGGAQFPAILGQARQRRADRRSIAVQAFD